MICIDLSAKISRQSISLFIHKFNDVIRSISAHGSLNTIYTFVHLCSLSTHVCSAYVSMRVCCVWRFLFWQNKLKMETHKSSTETMRLKHTIYFEQLNKTKKETKIFVSFVPILSIFYTRIIADNQIFFCSSEELGVIQCVLKFLM